MKKGMNSIFKGVILVSLLTFAVVKVLLLNYDSTYGQQYKNLNEKLKKLENENQVLAQKIASQSSIMVIALKAKDLGLTPSKLSVALNSPQPLANLPNTL